MPSSLPEILSPHSDPHTSRTPQRSHASFMKGLLTVDIGVPPVV